MAARPVEAAQAATVVELEGTVLDSVTLDAADDATPASPSRLQPPTRSKAAASPWAAKRPAIGHVFDERHLAQAVARWLRRAPVCQPGVGCGG